MHFGYIYQVYIFSRVQIAVLSRYSKNCFFIFIHMWVIIFGKICLVTNCLIQSSKLHLWKWNIFSFSSFTRSKIFALDSKFYWHSNQPMCCVRTALLSHYQWLAVCIALFIDLVISASVELLSFHIVDSFILIRWHLRRVSIHLCKITWYNILTIHHLILYIH